MKITPLLIPDVVVVEPEVFFDDRGFFFESFNAEKFAKAMSKNINFVQDNESHSKRGVLRGLHYQIGCPQAKLVRVSEGEIFDVAVDLRRKSPTFGCWVAERLSAENKKQLWIPEGFAHGFFVLSETARCHYKVTNYWSPLQERCVRYDDVDIGIAWPPLHPDKGNEFTPQLSERDCMGSTLKQAETF